MVAEIAVALVLLVGAGLLLRSFAALTRVSPGFKPEKLLVVNLPLSPLKYRDSVSRTAAVERIVSRDARLAGRSERVCHDDAADGGRRRDHSFQPGRISAEEVRTTTSWPASARRRQSTSRRSVSRFVEAGS